MRRKLFLYSLVSFFRFIYPWFTSVDHSKTLIGHLQDAALRNGRGLRVSDDSSNSLANDTCTFVRQRFHGSQVTQEVTFPFHFRRRGIEITVIHIDRIRRGEDTLATCSQVHTFNSHAKKNNYSASVFIITLTIIIMCD